MRIGIMVADLVPHDAVGNDAAGMYLALQRRGYESYLFTLGEDKGHVLDTYHYRDLPLLLSSEVDVVIYHYCIADAQGLDALRRFHGRIILRYHNVTPPNFMMPYSAQYARGCRLGREMIKEFAELPLIGILNDSNFNGTDFAPLIDPAIPMATLPPFHRVEELLGCAEDAPLREKLSREWFNIVTVGRIVPNKALDDMLDAFARLDDLGIKDVHLHIVGRRHPLLSSYSELLDDAVEDYGLEATVTWHDGISPQRLATLYRHCDLFWTTSRHEGFCVPVLEAMAFGLPVLSSRHGALPETCGEAAVFGNDAEDTASQLSILVTDDLQRVQLAEKGRRRYRDHFRIAEMERRFIAAIEDFCDGADSQVDPSSVTTAGDWFGIPDGETLVRAAMATATPGPAFRIAGLDRRRTFIDWILRQGRRRSPDVRAMLNAEPFRRYAAEISVPAVAAQLKAPMRLAWQFDAAARTGFHLQTPRDVSDFLKWYREFAEADYEVSLMPEMN